MGKKIEGVTKPRHRVKVKKRVSAPPQEKQLDEEGNPVIWTQEMFREREVDMQQLDTLDDDLATDEAFDEFANYFSGSKTPKIMLTTSKSPSGKIWKPFIQDLLTLFPFWIYKKRGPETIDQLQKSAIEEDFTDLIVLNIDKGEVNSLLLVHLPIGPSAFFKLDGITLRKLIRNHGSPTGHAPELILNNFGTRLGRRIGRMLHSICPSNPEFKGRQVVTMHLQRDFIFFRAHRYRFDDTEHARLQELGPRFTLKLRYLQAGLFDPINGEYEWSVGQHTSYAERRKWYL